MCDESIRRRRRQFELSHSDESGLEQNIYCQPNARNLHSSPSLQSFASSGQHSGSNAAYISWPTSTHINDAAEGRANFFSNLQKGVLPRNVDRLPRGHQASTFLDLMTIRAFHSKILRCFSLGTAIGFRIRKGVITDIPAILVFVARKVHKKWLSCTQCLPSALEGPGGVWCDIDVIEFSYYGAPTPTPKEQLYDELADGLRGSDPCIGSGSQVANLETYGTLGAIVKSRTEMMQVGFLTNRHVAVDLDCPSQKMFHPLPPNLGPGVYLGAVDRATSFITDDLWYGIFTGTNPEAVQGQRNAMTVVSNSRDSSPEEKPSDIFEPLGLNIQQISVDAASVSEANRCFEGIDVSANVEEHQFIPNSPIQRKQEANSEERMSLSALRDGSDEDLCFALHLGDREAKRQRSDSANDGSME